ncbi:hypothetical protein [Myroides sp. TSA_177.3]|uniref:hypothetical protein n=1 Tax=Myroides sp. TSA_177.3 TaxID=3415650 RepID=UPI004045C58C
MRKYYVPGMITLFLLPILGFVYLKNSLAERDYRGIVTSIEDKDEFGCQDELYQPFKNVVMESYFFRGDSNKDRLSLSKAKEKIEKIVLEKDENSGLVLHFSSISYGMYIEILDLMVTSRGETFVYADSIKFIYDRNYEQKQQDLMELELFHKQFNYENGVEDKSDDKVALVLYRMGNYVYAIGFLFLVLVFCCLYVRYIDKKQ